MRKFIRKLLYTILAAVILLVCSVTAFANGTVTYDGNAHEFIFEPGSDYSPTDLFTDFKNLMPGDSITQKVTISNRIEKNVKINVYMRSLGPEPNSEEFLSKLDLTVNQEDGSNLFSAHASKTAQLSDWVCLGTVYSGGNIDLDLTLNVPATMDNNFQDAVGYLNWQFKVEELPIEEDDPKPPQTGDNFGIVLYLFIALVSAVSIITLITACKIKKSRSE